MDVDGFVGGGRSRHEAFGFNGNRIHIPGLEWEAAKELKAIILQRVEENKVNDNQSGL